MSNFFQLWRLVLERKKYRLALFSFFALCLFALAGCGENTEESENIEQRSTLYTGFSKDGLTFNYPADWAIRFEFGAGIYADYSVGIETPDLSIIRVMVFDDKSLDLDAVARKLERGFSLEASDKVSNVEMSVSRVGDFEGRKTSWDYQLLGTTRAEFELYKVDRGSSPVFVSFEFSGEDISRHLKVKGTLLETVTYSNRDRMALSS